MLCNAFQQAVLHTMCCLYERLCMVAGQVAGSRAAQRSTTERAAAVRELLVPLDLPRLLGPALAARNPGAAVLFWKLLVVQGPANAMDSAQEWLCSKLSLNR